MENKQASRLLRAAITALERDVVPNLKTDHSGITLDLVIRILSMLDARFDHRDIDLQHLIEQTQSLLARSDDMLNPDAPGTAAHPPVSGLEKTSGMLEAKMAVLIPALVEKAAGGNGQGSLALNTLQQIVGVQESFLAAQDPDILGGSAVVYRGGRIDRSTKAISNDGQAPVNEQSLSAYLQARFPENAGISAESVRVVTGGFSKTTLLFDIRQPGGELEKRVIRKDLPVAFMNKSVVDEFPLLKRLHAAGMNVARPHWLESDVEQFGGRFFVSDAVAGSSDFTQWAGSQEAALNVSNQLAELLAELHGFDPVDLGYPASTTPKSAGAAMEDEIAFWQELYERRRLHHHTLLEIVLAWLRQNIPAELYDRPARLVHGDAGFHNLMVDDGKVTALLDWEFAHFGDPAEDLLYVRPFIEQIADWDQFLLHYQQCGGSTFAAETGVFFKLWSLTRNPIGTIDARYLFENHLPDELKLAVSGIVFGSYLELDASRFVLDILAREV